MLSPNGSLIWHLWGVGGSSCLEASHLPSTCSCGRGCACASVCVAECSACACVCVCREGGERGISHSTALCQAPSAAPFYFALNGLSKDPLSRAAESFLHFKKKKKKKGRNFFWVNVEVCEEMLNSSSLWQELRSDRRRFALCSPSGRTVIAQPCPTSVSSDPSLPPWPLSCSPVSGSPPPPEVPQEVARRSPDILRRDANRTLATSKAIEAEGSPLCHLAQL